MDDLFPPLNLQKELDTILNNEILSSVFEITLSFPTKMSFVIDFNKNLKGVENNEDNCVSYLMLKEGLVIPKGWAIIDTWVSPDNEVIEELGAVEYEEPYGVISVHLMRVMNEYEFELPPDEYEN